MIKKNKTKNEILPYTYLLKFIIENQIVYYYGVRCGNVIKNINPSDDIFETYFTSSKYVKELLKDNIFPFEIIIHKTFSTHKEASYFEVEFLKKLRVRERNDFLNQTDRFNNCLPNNKGRKLSTERKQQISIKSIQIQSDPIYREKRSEIMKKKWEDPKFIEFMKEKNDNFWKSENETLLQFKKKRSEYQKGKTHTQETKIKMSLIHKEICSKIDCKARAAKRKRFDCPICDMKNLDGANFNNHMRVSHQWTKELSQNFKIETNDTHR